MDIIISSNLERLLYLVTGEDDALIRDWFNQLATTGKYEVNDAVKAVLKDEFFGGYCDDVDTKKTIKEIYDKYGYTCDTHTAVAVKVYEDYKAQTGDTTKTIIASTASPYKFSASVLEAIDGQVSDIDEYDMVSVLNERSNMPIPQSLADLKNKERRFNKTIDKSDMKPFVLETLGL
jgi:threonine synthase